MSDTDKTRELFDRHVDKSGGTNACHLWTAYRLPSGYGSIKFQGRTELAHRISFFLANGRWPDPCCCHKCDNPSCVNPAHLFEGSQADNAADMVAKGRSARGSKSGAHTKPLSRAKGQRHGRAKLTEADVVAIRAEYAAGAMNQYQLADKYGVGQMSISRIVRGKKWAHVPL